MCEAEELQGQLVALMGCAALALPAPAQTSTAPSLLAASVAEVKCVFPRVPSMYFCNNLRRYLTELSQIQSRIMQQQRQLQGDLVYIVAHTWETPPPDPQQPLA